MPTIEEVIAANRARVLGRTQGPMLRALLIDYSRVRARVEREVISLAASIARADTPPISALLREQRLTVLLDQVENQLRVITGREAVRVERAATLAVDLGTTDAVAMALSVAAEESALTVPASERIIASLQRGSPLNALVNEIPVQARMAVQNALVDGVIRGLNPRVTARAVSGALGGQTARALTIARTETMRAYRAAQLEVYRANPDVVAGWVWVSARDQRTCAMCWAMHGTKHELDEVFGSHPSCRCNPGPTVLGPDSPVVRLGTERFAALSAREQLHILGPAKYRAYREGALDLPDLVGVRNDPRWGLVRGERSLTAVLGQDRAMAYRRAAVARPRPPSPPPELPDLTALRDGIRANTTETAFAYQRGGALVLNKSQGLPAAVTFTDDEVALMRGTVLVHNHPRGSAFSITDANFAHIAELDEIEVVSRLADYRMQITPAGRALPTDVFRGRIEESERAVRRSIQPRFDSGELTAEQADFMHGDALWRMMQDQGLVTYARELR